MPSIAENVNAVTARVEQAAARAGRDPSDIVLIGASKQVEPARLREALNAGLRHLGENYVQEALPKIAELSTAATWHFIGHLQANKVGTVVDRFAFVHSIDRRSLLEALHRRADDAGVIVQGLIEVNLLARSRRPGPRLRRRKSSSLGGVTSRTCGWSG